MKRRHRSSRRRVVVPPKPTTPSRLTVGEDKIFDALLAAAPSTFGKRLYRDGVPTPKSYLVQKVRVVFVFREPNLGGRPREWDMRAEVRDPQFRPLGAHGQRQARSLKGWWNWKAGMFAHAAAAALEGEGWRQAYDRFRAGGWNHEVVNRFGYVQIKKIGGKGQADPTEIREHARKHGEFLKAQINLYAPHLLIGCGVGSHSPAKLLAENLYPNAALQKRRTTGPVWWAFPGPWPRAMVQLWHPARRGSQAELYADVWKSVREVAHDHLGLV